MEDAVRDAGWGCLFSLRAYPGIGSFVPPGSGVGRERVPGEEVLFGRVPQFIQTHALGMGWLHIVGSLDVFGHFAIWGNAHGLVCRGYDVWVHARVSVLFVGWGSEVCDGACIVGEGT